MTALPVTIPFPGSSQPSPLDRLRGTAAKSKSGHLVYDGSEAQASATDWLTKSKQSDELARELSQLRHDVITAVNPWHADQVVRKRKWTPTVLVETPAGELRVTYQSKYNKIVAQNEQAIREAVDGDFDRLFTRQRSLSVRKAVTEDAGAFDALVAILREQLGNEMFEHCFEVEESLAPTKAFTETQHALSDAARAMLALAGVKQVVMVAKGGRE